jgi:DNA modification methylase
MVAEELLFEPTPAFGEYKPFLEHAVAHPAKANTRLLEFLVERFTKAGDVILDPMAGSGSMGVVAALHGRNAVQVELEKKFYEWMEKAREKVEKHPTLISKGWIKNICGDARRLSELLSNVDIAITGLNKDDKGLKLGCKWNGYSTNPTNIDNLHLGNIDTVITSPPYEMQHQGGQDAPKVRHGCVKEKYPSKNNIANLPLGEISTIITSPPYAECPGSVQSNGQIANLPLGEKGNIGNLKRETYLDAMYKVYIEMFKVLKPNGLAIIIVKPFIRNKKVVDLPWYTWLLMAKVGFTLEKLYKLRLRTASFWRILYYKKYSNVPKINHEYVLICKKPVQNVG